MLNPKIIVLANGYDAKSNPGVSTECLVETSGFEPEYLVHVKMFCAETWALKVFNFKPHLKPLDTLVARHLKDSPPF